MSESPQEPVVSRTAVNRSNGDWDDGAAVLSNRRFAKLLEGLKGLDPDARHALLEKHFKRLLAQYEEMLSRFLIVNKPVPEDFVVLLRIGVAQGDAPNAHGTRHSLRAIALLSGILGDEKMWPLLREAFKHPLCGLEIDEVQYIEGAREEMSDHPVFCEGIQAQVVHLFASSLDDKRAADVGFKRNDALEVLAEFRQAQEAKAAADENPLRRRYLYNVTKKIVIPNYQARAISYDERLGEVDLSHGYNEVEFLVTEDEEFFERMVKAATPSDIGLETP